MRKNKIIVNPISGNGTGMRIVPYLQETLQRYGIPYAMTFTERPWHAAEIAYYAAEQEFENVVAVGGDGTANEVINGLMAAGAAGLKKPALAIISVGRGNDMAYGMNIPSDLESAVETLADGRKKTCDIGLIKGGDYPEGRYFANGVGIGFDAVVGFEAAKIKRIKGFANYIAAAMKTISLYYRAPQMRLEYDGLEISQPCLMVSIMNGRRMGGGFYTAPNARADDGLFDLCIAGQIDRLAILGVMMQYMKGTQENHPAVKVAKARHVKITPIDDSLPVHADGETICKEGGELELEIVPAAIEVICQSKR